MAKSLMHGAIKIQIDFFEPVLTPAIRQKLFPPKGGQVIVANLPALNDEVTNSLIGKTRQLHYLCLSVGG